jgi:hypothetical protein
MKPIASQPNSSPPIEINPGVAANCDSPEAFKRFDALVRKVLSVPHEEIMRREAEYKRQSAMNPNRRGPKPNKRKAAKR